MRLLIVEDSDRLRQTLATALRKSGYAVDAAADGEEGQWLAENNAYDAIILDIMLPKRDGLAVLANLRREKIDTHVLLLTARDTVADRVQGLRAGADDYLIKPFALDELLARVEALCRRAYGAKQSLIKIADLEIDTAARAVRRAGTPVELSAREYSLLEYLAKRHGQIVTRSEIEAHIYDNAADPMSNVVDSAICILRKKLEAGADESAGADAPAPLIHTRRGIGYVLSETPAQ